jgi:Tol biopolymer transport system component
MISRVSSAKALAIVLAATGLVGCNTTDNRGRVSTSGKYSTSQTTAHKEQNYSLRLVPAGYGYVERNIVDIEPNRDNRVILRRTLALATVDAIENSTNVKAVTRMTDYKGAYEADVPRVSPDGATILYQLREEQGNINLWTMASQTGTNKTRNTEGDYLNFSGSWSSRGDKILFSSNRTDLNAHLWEIKSNGGGGGLRRITDSRESDLYVYEPPALTDTLVYTRYQIGAPTIWTYNRKTYLSTQLRVGRQAQVSPDGSLIAYSAYDEQEGHWNIWTMHTDGSHPTQLTSGDADNITPGWHPSGQWVIFASNKGAVTAKLRAGEGETQVHNFDIWMMNANGEHMSQLTQNGSDDDNPCFSPDGKIFYFSSNRGHALETLSSIGIGRDIWRAEITEDVISMDVGNNDKAERKNK